MEDFAIGSAQPSACTQWKWPRWIWQSLAVIFIIAGCFLLLIFSFYRYRAHQAKNLILAMRGLKIGESDSADVSMLVTKYRSALLAQELPNSSESTFSFRIDTAFWSLLDGHGAWSDNLAGHLLAWMDSPFWGRMGLRNFMLTTNVRVANGRVAGTAVSLMVEGACHKWLGADWVVRMQLPNFPAHNKIPKNSNTSKNLVIQWSHLHMGFETGEVLIATVTPRATPLEKGAAFTINSACMTSSSGCFYLADIMPIAVEWQKSQKKWPLGWTSQTCPNHPNPD